MLLPERDRIRLEHILGAARSAMRFAESRQRSDLDADEMLRFAIVHALAIVGEAASPVSSETRAALPGVPWSRVVGMRHRLIHGHFEVDLDRVWDTLTHYVPLLIAQLEDAL